MTRHGRRRPAITESSGQYVGSDVPITGMLVQVGVGLSTNNLPRAEITVADGQKDSLLC